MNHMYLILLTSSAFNPYPAYIFVIKMPSTYYVCCLDSNAHQNCLICQLVSGACADPESCQRGSNSDVFVCFCIFFS